MDFVGGRKNADICSSANQELNRSPSWVKSAQFVPDPTSATVLVQVPAFDQRTEMLLERIAARTGQFDGLADGDATMFAGKFDDLQRQFRQCGQHKFFALHLLFESPDLFSQ